MSTQEAMDQAHQELKRADHSIAVSLKYTRTVDVIKSIIDRLINTISFGFDTLLTHANEEKKVDEIPTLPRLKIELLNTHYPEDETIQHFIQFFQLLRRINKAQFTRTQEYRRHVTMTATLDDGTQVQITIDIITDYFDRTNEFLKYIYALYKPDDDE